MTHHLIYLFFILLKWIIYTYRMAPISVHKTHTRNICIAIPNINHVTEWDSLIFRLNVIINTSIINIENSFLNAEQKLCLIRIVNGLCRPNSDTFIVEHKCTGIDFGESPLFCHFSAFDHFF